jgi:hypothetical protein
MSSITEIPNRPTNPIAAETRERIEDYLSADELARLLAVEGEERATMMDFLDVWERGEGR